MRTELHVEDSSGKHIFKDAAFSLTDKDHLVIKRLRELRPIESHSRPWGNPTTISEQVALFRNWISVKEVEVE